MKEICSRPEISNLHSSGHLQLAGVLIVLITIFIVVSCTGKDEFSTGDNFIEEKTRLSVIDTFEVKMSTVLLDSISTSGTGIALVGSYRDGIFGSLVSMAYFEPGFKSLDIDETCVFDSASVALVYSGYSYGDTTTLMSVSISLLDEQIEPNENNYLYNTSSFDFSDKLLGSRTFYPEPHSADTFFIPVNAFGELLFELFRNQDADVSSSELFLKYIKGLVLKSDSGNSVIGFKADANQTFLKFYFHIDTETNIESSVSLPFGAVTEQFNSLHCDYSDSDLEEASRGKLELLSEETGDQAFLQGMAGLLPKLKFPSLQNITLENRWRILKAELVLAPVIQSYVHFPLPAKLCLYRTDKYNSFGTVLTDTEGAVIYPTLTTDDLFNEDSSYSFDITNFINDELSDGYADSNAGLLIGLPESDLHQTLERLLLECRNPSAKLRLYYLTY